MQFHCSGRVHSGVTRDQVMARLDKTEKLALEELATKGVVSNVHYKLGEQLGVDFRIKGGSLDEVRAIINELPAVQDGLMEFELSQVNESA